MMKMFWHWKQGAWFKRTQRLSTVVVHHTAGRTICGGYSTKATKLELRSIDRQHKEKDWGDGYRAPSIVYHFAVDLSGRVFICNNPNRHTWHAGSQKVNAEAVSVVVLGNFDIYDMSNEEKQNVLRAFDEILERLRRNYGLHKDDWIGHGDVKATRCPGSGLSRLLDHWKMGV